MSKKIFSLAITALLMGNLYAQNQCIDDLKFSNPETKILIDSLCQYLGGISEKKLTSSATLNKFFTAKVSSYLSEASDLSLSKAYAVLDNSDGRLFLGTTRKFKPKSKTSRLLYTAGIKANINDGFANLFGSNGIQDDIGISLKIIKIGKGTIWFDKNKITQKDIVKNKRRELANELIGDFDSNLSKYRKNLIGLADTTGLVNSYVEDNNAEFVDQFLEKESEYISKKKLFNQAVSQWVSADIYIPVTKSTFNTVENLASTNLNISPYRPFELNILYSYFWEWNDRVRTKDQSGDRKTYSLLLTGKGSLLANNSANASLIDSYSFDKYLERSMVSDTLFLARLESEKVYVGKFERFLTPKLSLRVVFMYRELLGLSLAVETLFGKTNNLNWRIGVPVSLKDEDGLSKINFEILWREIGKQRSFGLSIGLPIGNTVF